MWIPRTHAPGRLDGPSDFLGDERAELLPPFFPEFIFDPRKHDLAESQIRGIDGRFDNVDELQRRAEFPRDADSEAERVLGMDGEIDRDEERANPEGCRTRGGPVPGWFTTCGRFHGAPP